MSLPVSLPIQIAGLWEDVKRDLQTSDKALAHDLGYTSQGDFSKAKHGARPFPLERLLKAPLQVQESFHRMHGEALAREADAKTQRTDRDLVEDAARLIGRLNRLLAGSLPMLKADLADERDERRSA